MSQQAIKHFFQSQKRKNIGIKYSDKPNTVLSTIDVEEAIQTGKHFDSESLFKHLINYTLDEYTEDSQPNCVVHEKTFKPSNSMHIREVTNDMVREKEQEEAYREEEEYFKSFQEYVPPPRPKDELDVQLEQIKVELEKTKQQLDEELMKPIPNVKGYIPPTRKKEYNLEFNPTVKQLEHTIGHLENGIQQLTSKMNKENERWIQHRKIMYRSEYIQKKLKELSALQEKDSNSSTM